jgi:hypothetical protein
MRHNIWMNQIKPPEDCAPLGGVRAVRPIFAESEPQRSWKSHAVQAVGVSPENHQAAIALHFGFYNFCQLHGSLRVTPAMEASQITFGM